MVITAVIQAALEVHSALPRLFPNRPDHLNALLEENRAKVEEGTKYIADNFATPPSPEDI